jgi:hypothetical protein
MIVVVVVWVVVVTVVVVCPTTCLSAGAHSMTGLPTGTLSSVPNWSLRLTSTPFVAGMPDTVAQVAVVHAFALIL